MGQYFLFCSCQLIALAYFFAKWRRSPTIMGSIYSWFGAMDNALLHTYGHSRSNTREEQITFTLSLARLYLSESDDEQDDKSDSSNKLYISCGGGRSSTSLSSITVSVLAASDIVRCWIFTSYLFLPNYLLSSDDMVDWDNDSILGIWGVDTIIDEDLFVLHNMWWCWSNIMACCCCCTGVNLDTSTMHP